MGTLIRDLVATWIRRETEQTGRALAAELAEQGTLPATVWPRWWVGRVSEFELPRRPGEPETGRTSLGEASPFFRSGVR